MRLRLRPYPRRLLVPALLLLALAPGPGRPGPAPLARAATLNFTVTSTADRHDAHPGDGVCADAAGQCTLRAAIEEADAQPQGSSVVVRVPAGTYTLALGTLGITRNSVTLNGVSGTNGTMVNGSGQRILAVAAGALAQIDGLTLSGGVLVTGKGGALANQGVTIIRDSAFGVNAAGSGGAIYNALGARLWLLGSTIGNGIAPGGSGGAIANLGALTIAGSTLINNTAKTGAAIANTGTLTLANSSVSDNLANAGACGPADGGAGLYNGGVARVISDTFSGNTAPGASCSGGAMLNAAGGLLAVSDTTVSANTVAGNGAGIENLGRLLLSSSAVVSNTALMGGGLDNAGTARLAQVSVAHNQSTLPLGAAYGGGGVYNTGALTVTRSTLDANTDLNGGGAIANAGGSALVGATTLDANIGGAIGNSAGTVTVAGSHLDHNREGSAITNKGILSLTASTLDGNTSANVRGGGLDNTGGTATVSQSSFTNNSTNASGGGIDNQADGVLTVTASTFENNRANLGGGLCTLTAGRGNPRSMATITDSTFSDNTSGGGGAICVSGGPLTLTGSTLRGNISSGQGGGIGTIEPTTHYAVVVSDTTIIDNSAALDGGAIQLNGTLKVADSTIANNTSTSGGSALSGSGTLALDNTTITGSSGGAVFLNNNYGDTVTISSSTIVSNSLGLYLLIATPAHIANTIIADSTGGPNCGPPDLAVYGDDGYNLDSGATCGFTATTSMSNTNPLLGPLQNNGGPTPTMALLPGSPAIDSGATAALGCPARDQRGQPRPDDGETRCDRGAYESQGVG